VSFARLIVKELSKTKADLNRIDKARVKAGETAVKVEGFRLKNELTKEIRSGAPGGKKFVELSMIARKRSKTTKPLRRLATATRYGIDKSGNKMGMDIGFIASKSSKSWANIASRVQAGARWEVSDAARKYLINYGSALTKRSKFRKYFFLKKTTTHFVTPPRPIIEPFWNAHKREALENIQSNYRKKLKGERI